MSDLDPEAHYRALCAKVDAFFERVEAKHRDSMQCHTGCSDCCQAGLTVTLVEAATIARHLIEAEQPSPSAEPESRAPTAEPEEPAHGTAGAGSGSQASCVALDPAGRCTIYTVRPLVCRSHGLPIRHREPGHCLPVLDSCFRNFTGGELEGTAPEDQLDQVTLSTTLAAIDAAFADAAGAPRGLRLDLADLLDDPSGLFDLS